MSINWKSGLHRAFIVGCVVWALYILAVVPFQMVQQRRDFAARYTTWSVDHKIPPDERKMRQDSLWEEASLPAVYSSLIAEEGSVRFAVGIIVLPPLILYASIVLLWILLRWLRDGFFRPQR